MSTDSRQALFSPANWFADISAGIVVFLVALPLCLGIAVASNATPFSGLLAGIIGGLVVATLSKSHTSVSGPAAGLTAVVAGLIASLGSFEIFLIALVLAGVIQVALGIFRAGSIADFVPTSVIKGLLAAIGVILILKQLPHLVGHDKDVFGEMSFFQPDKQNTFSELWLTLTDFHVGAMIVGLISLVVLVVWERIPLLKKSLIPGPLVVVVGGLMAVYFSEAAAGWSQDHLVKVPVANSMREFVGFFKLPNFSALLDFKILPDIVIAAFTIAAVASLETLLNLEAVDKIDPQKRVSPPNPELVAQGVGNILGGFIGALPVTSVIVRSSVNISMGGKTKFSAIFHGMLLLLCVYFLASWLNIIPLSCLAAVLIVTGFKLASPKVFRQMWKGGWEQFIPFVVTVSAIVLTDLLIGILIGLGVSLVFILRSNLKRPLTRIQEHHMGDDVLRIQLSSQVSFLNRAALSKALNEVPANSHVCIDATNTDYIDADVLALIQDFEKETAPVRNIKVSLLGFKEHYEQVEDRIEYVDHATRESKERLSAGEIKKILAEGNRRYCEGRSLKRNLGKQRSKTMDHQAPLAIILSGAGGRTPVETIFDVGVGEISCARASGNVATDAIIGTLEYSVGVLDSRLIVVLGHSRNSVVRMAIENYLGLASAQEPPANVLPILREIQDSIDEESAASWKDMTDEQQRQLVDVVAVSHVLNTIKAIKERSPGIAARVESGEVEIVGAYYHMESGEVEFFDSPDRPPHSFESLGAAVG